MILPNIVLSSHYTISMLISRATGRGLWVGQSMNCCSIPLGGGKRFYFPTQRQDLSSLLRDGPRNVSAPGILIIWGPLKLIFCKLFRPTTGLEKLFMARFQTEGNFRRNSFACRNLSLQAPYFRVLKWRTNAHYWLVSRAVARDASHLN